MKKLVIAGLLAVLFLPGPAAGRSKAEEMELEGHAREAIKSLNDLMESDKEEHHLDRKAVKLSFSIEDVSEMKILVINSFYARTNGIRPYYRIEIKLKKPTNEIEKLFFPSTKLGDLIVFSDWIKEGRSVRVFVDIGSFSLSKDPSEDEVSRCFPACQISSWSFILFP